MNPTTKKVLDENPKLRPYVARLGEGWADSIVAAYLHGEQQARTEAVAELKKLRVRKPKLSAEQLEAEFKAIMAKIRAMGASRPQPASTRSAAQPAPAGQPSDAEIRHALAKLPRA